MSSTAHAVDPGRELVARYLDRVVNRRDPTGVDELVAPDYEGTGPAWPRDRPSLRRFYEEQYALRPDWRIDLQETLCVGGSVVARALAGGTVHQDGEPRRRRVEWLTRYAVRDGLVLRIDVLELVELAPGPDRPPG